MLEILKSILFGIVEGITEWLPISSTGHLILLNELVSLNSSEEYKKMYDVVIQLGAILAVVILYWKSLWPFGKKENIEALTSKGPGAYVKKDIFNLWIRIMISCVPAAIVGVAFDDFLDSFFKSFTVAIMLILFGIAFIVVEKWNKTRTAKITALADITYTTALLIGLFQLIAAIFPGTSRSGATIVGALLIGVSRTVAAEYTFLLAVPVMLGASMLKMAKFFLKGGSFSGLEIVVLLTGMVVSFAVSMFVIKFLMTFIKKHDFIVFGWYRIVLGIIVIICGAAGLINLMSSMG